jgi:hypothetical protein
VSWNVPWRRDRTASDQEKRLVSESSAGARVRDLQGITTTTLNKVYAELHASGRRKGSGAGLSARTVTYIHTIVHRALSDAAADGLIPRNPAATARPPKHKDGSGPEERRTWSPEELRLFLDHIRHDRRPWLYR